MGGREAGNGSASQFHWKEKNKTHNSASQVTRSDYDVLVPTDLVDLGTSAESQLNMLVCMCPPSLGLTPTSPLLSSTQPN